MTLKRISMVGLTSAMAAAVAAMAAPATPIGVSPGGEGVFLRVESRCPTFSWSGVTGAGGYELVVYRADSTALGPDPDTLPEGEPVSRTRLPAAALSWTPSEAECFERGGRYVWFIRARHSAAGKRWSAGRLFAVGSRITAGEAERALEILEAYFSQEGADSSRGGPADRALLDTVAIPGIDAVTGPAEPAVAAPVPTPTEVWGIRSESNHDTLKSFALWGIALNNETGTAGVLGQATSDTGFVDGVRGETSSYDGVGVSGRSTRTDGHATGVEGYTAAAQGYGGLFSHGSSGGTALYARAADDASADLVLGSNSTSTNDGVLRSHPGDSSSDLRIESNDFIVLRLDRDNNSPDSYFALRNGADGDILHITEAGVATLTGSMTVSGNLTVSGAVGGNLVSDSEAEAICQQAVEDHENAYHPMRIFVTSATYDGDLGGTTGANQKCQDRAGAAGLPGTFRAWISTSSTSASENIDNPSSRAYWLPNDVKVADNWQDLVSCSGSCLDAAINRDEFGDPVDSTKVWTATTTSGSWKGSGTPGDCASWTDDYEFEAGWTGLPSDTDNDWTDWGNQGCSLAGRLYCVQN